MSQKATLQLISPKVVARFLIGILLIAVLLYRFDAQEILSTIRSAKPAYLAMAIGVYSITLLILSARWKWIISNMGGHLSIATAYQAFVSGVFLSDLTLMRIGDLSRPFIVRDQLDLNIGIASVAVDRFSDVITVSLLGFLGVVLVSMQIEWYIIPALSILLMILFLGSMFWIKRPFLLNLIERIGYARLNEMANALNRALENLKDLPGLMAGSIFLTLVAWVGHALRIVLIAKSFGYDPPLQVLFLLLPLVSALSLIPITISGLGLVEGGLTTLLAGLGIPAEVGLSIALVDRAMTVAFHMIVGWRYTTKML
jgi:glycosyltransferase 2 family protein